MRELGVVGGCNVQLALDPYSENYYVIEVNPRVSRSSALASKATGYPIAKVTSKIAVGYNLDEIENAVTKKTKACFEPTIDYIVLKFPRWPFDKFVTADRTLGTQMKATGEVMAIERSFEASMLKAVRCLEIGLNHLEMPELKALSDEEIHDRIKRIDDERCFVVAEAIRRGITLEEIHDITKIALIVAAILLLIGGIAGYFYWKRKKRLEAEAEAARLAEEEAELERQRAEEARAAMLENGEIEPEEMTQEEQEHLSERQTIEELIRNKPAEMAMLVKTWLSED